MSPVALVMPDVVAISIRWLLADARLVALVEDRVSSKSPADIVYPYVLVQRIGGIAIAPRGIDMASLQISSWGNDDDEADEVARTALAAMVSMTNYRSSAGVATFNSIELGLAASPDTVRTPPTPRSIFGVSVTAHPAN